MIAGPTLPPISETTIRHAVDSVFRTPEFNRFSLWSKLWEWVGHVLQRAAAALQPFFSALRGSPPLFWTVIVILAVMLVAVVVRLVYLWYERERRRAAGGRWESVPRQHAAGDPWLVAQELAAAGNFTDAAHALYLALLQAAARQQQIRLHPSKTMGDYRRELRSRSSSLFGRFRDFARSYETVIYGIGSCDRERYERLHALALPIVRPAGNA
jgi:Domain of unknown function (DUF4129)